MRGNAERLRRQLRPDGSSQHPPRYRGRPRRPWPDHNDAPSLSNDHSPSRELHAARSNDHNDTNTNTNTNTRTNNGTHAHAYAYADTATDVPYNASLSLSPEATPRWMKSRPGREPSRSRQVPRSPRLRAGILRISRRRDCLERAVGMAVMLQPARILTGKKSTEPGADPIMASYAVASSIRGGLRNSGALDRVRSRHVPPARGGKATRYAARRHRGSHRPACAPLQGPYP